MQDGYILDFDKRTIQVWRGWRLVYIIRIKEWRS